MREAREETVVWRYFNRDVVPFSVILVVECITVGSNTLFKAATLRGLSFYVFVFYSYVVSTLLLPLSLIFGRSRRLPSAKSSFFLKLFLLGLLGFIAQISGCKGIEYSSPTLASAISNLTPAFTFTLAASPLSSTSSLGWLITGNKRCNRPGCPEVLTAASFASSSESSWMDRRPFALLHRLEKTSVEMFYRLLWSVQRLDQSRCTRLQPSMSLSSSSPTLAPSMSNLTPAFTFTLAIIFRFYLLFFFFLESEEQTRVMEAYPEEITVVFIYNLFANANLNTCMFDCGNALTHTWGLHLKGPVYVSMFRPLSIAIAVSMGAIYSSAVHFTLGGEKHLVSRLSTVPCVIGSVILCFEFYTVIWGKVLAVEQDILRFSFTIRGGRKSTCPSDN
uniref:WAT1-related protein n=1 Tax=Brassica oleracea var. oleracea TaxID=109376 RepID=A0A0D3CT15_BRAOL